MKHFNNLSIEQKEKIFLKLPQEFNNETSQNSLKYAIGSLLYTPGNKKDIYTIITEKKYPEVTSMAWCLEDALCDENIQEGEENVFFQLEQIRAAVKNATIKENDIPLIFIRVRDVSQLRRLLLNIDNKKLHIDDKSGIKYLTGFIFPKFTSKVSRKYLNVLSSYNEALNYKFYCMPIIESSDVMYKENRYVELIKIQRDLSNDIYKDIILNVRIGATDFSSIYGLRRGVDNTVYDISVIRDVICDIINVFGRNNRQVISGPVWEHFDQHDGHRVLKPTLRETPFKNRQEDRKVVLNTATDGLIREVLLDKSNGLCGKTTIHPSHVKYINALQVITEEEYLDAKAILESNGSGVMKSASGNKMNEVKPHTNWAKQIVAKASIFGVIRKDEHYANLF